jgi:hypothetical protein
MTPASLLVWLGCKNLLNFGLKRRQVFGGCEPDFLDVHSEVIVNEFVTHAGDVVPRNLWRDASQFLG